MSKTQHKKHKKKLLGQECLFCGTKDNLTLHHIIPRRIGGKDDTENLVLLCEKCHQSLHQILLDPVIEYLGKKMGST